MANTDDLETFFPEVRTVSIAGKTLAIPNLKVRQLSAFAKVSEPFMPLIVTADYMAVLTHHTEAACQAVSIVTGTDVAWLMDLDPDEMLRLISAVYEVNFDFFARRLLPERAAAGERLMALMINWAGAKPSLGSSDADTTSPSLAN
ncbi:hypothetical protein [Cypionkella psychrotolerans]|uniref:hypothetical protein n=1 Tax=Cypionkella psychrotolerans TaxID=1678131 RepID=UPI0006B5AAE7|nr:hypothetical protein [Cypionkella psychrotolerans]